MSALSLIGCGNKTMFEYVNCLECTVSNAPKFFISKQVQINFADRLSNREFNRVVMRANHEYDQYLYPFLMETQDTIFDPIKDISKQTYIDNQLEAYKKIKIKKTRALVESDSKSVNAVSKFLIFLNETFYY